MSAEKTATEGESSGGVCESSEPSEPSAVPCGESKAPSHEPATGDAERAPAPEKAPQQKVTSEGKPKETAASSVLPNGASGDGDPEPPLTSKAAPRQKMRPCLDGLTDSLTLRIFSELDFRSLAAVKRVCRRLGRIAQDPSLFGRVSRVQWTSGDDYFSPRPFRSYEIYNSYFLTDCSQLGPIEMPEEDAEAGRKFLVILEGLLEGGASPVSLQTPLGGHESALDCLAPLPALLTKHKVRLEALACGSYPPLLELVRTQPGLTHLCLPYPPSRPDQVLELLPSLRHLSLGKSSGECIMLAPQLRSVVYFDASDDGMRDLLDAVRKTGFLFRAVGSVSFVGVKSFNMAFAVEGFRRDERGRAFLVGGKPWDSWDEAKNSIPQPTNDPDTVLGFRAVKSVSFRAVL